VIEDDKPMRWLDVKMIAMRFVIIVLYAALFVVLAPFSNMEVVAMTVLGIYLLQVIGDDS